MISISEDVSSTTYDRKSDNFHVRIKYWNDSDKITPNIDTTIICKNLKNGVTYYKNKLNHKTVWQGTLYTTPAGVISSYEGIKLEYE